MTRRLPPQFSLAVLVVLLALIGLWFLLTER